MKKTSKDDFHGSDLTEGLSELSKVISAFYAKKMTDWLYADSYFKGGREVKVTVLDRIRWKINHFIYDSRHWLGEKIAGDSFSEDY